MVSVYNWTFHLKNIACEISNMHLYLTLPPASALILTMNEFKHALTCYTSLNPIYLTLIFILIYWTLYLTRIFNTSSNHIFDTIYLTLLPPFITPFCNSMPPSGCPVLHGVNPNQKQIKRRRWNVILTRMIHVLNKLTTNTPEGRHVVYFYR